MRSLHLFDVNLLVASTVVEHVHFEAAQNWNEAHKGNPFATCAITENGLFRLLVNRNAQSSPIHPEMALACIAQIHAHPDHCYVEPLPSPQAKHFSQIMSKVRGHKQATDAYLIALAAQHGGKLATFDRKLADTFGEEYLELVPTT